MSDLANKILGWTMATAGGLGAITSIIQIVEDPRRLAGYAFGIASGYTFYYGVRRLQQAYNYKR